MISVLWCLIWHLLYELPRGDDNLYVPLSVLVHHECPSVNLLLPAGHLPAPSGCIRYNQQGADFATDFVALLSGSGETNSYGINHQSCPGTQQSTQHRVHSTEYRVHSTQHTAHSRVHSTEYTAHNSSVQHTARSTQHTEQSTQHTAQSTQHRVHSTEYTAQSTQHRVHSTEYTAHSTEYTAHSTQHTAHSTQHTAHSTQHTAHSTQHTAQSTQQHRCIRRLAYRTAYWWRNSHPLVCTSTQCLQSTCTFLPEGPHVTLRSKVRICLK